MTKNKYLPYIMWAIPLLFFSDQFILRLWPGLMMQQIMEQFSIGATSFGILAASYYYGYAGMQIPIAVMLDKYGAKSMVFLFAVLCGLATLLFTYSNNYYLALLSRFLIGAGSAVGFLGTSKVISEWFPKDSYARMIGFSFTFGLMGAIYGGKPISLLIESYSWHSVAFALAIIAILIGCGAYLVLRSPNHQTRTSQEVVHFRDFLKLVTYPSLLLLALANLLMVGSLEGFADVWGVTYLVKSYQLDKSDAAGIVSFIFYGMLVGGPLLAYVSKRLGTYTVIAGSGFGMAAAFVVLFLTADYNWWLLSTLFFWIGMLCCYQVIVFAAGADLVQTQYLGVTIAFLNCINMLGGSFFHTLIGKVLDSYWSGTIGEGGHKVYSLLEYKYAISVIPMCSILGSVIVYYVGLFEKKRQRQLYLEVK